MRGVYGLGPNSVRQHVFEIPYTIYRYESGIFENKVSGFDCILLAQIGPLGDKILLEMAFGDFGPELSLFIDFL